MKLLLPMIEKKKEKPTITMKGSDTKDFFALVAFCAKEKEVQISTLLPGRVSQNAIS
jgi:hypothetical protein